MKEATKSLQKLAPWYLYNPYTPVYFKDSDKWINYLMSCSPENKVSVMCKIKWLHQQLGHFWIEKRRDVARVKYYQAHRNDINLPGYKHHEYETIMSRLARNEPVKAPAAMAPRKTWSWFMFNCMDGNELDKIDKVLVAILNARDEYGDIKYQDEDMPLTPKPQVWGDLTKQIEDTNENEDGKPRKRTW